MWEVDYKESWALKNWCFWTVVLEKTLESPLDCKEIQSVHPKGNQSWKLIGIFRNSLIGSWNSNILATWCEELTHCKRPWCWERLKPEEEGDNRGWDGWMASPTRWTWVWASSRNWWWTGRCGVLQSIGLQRSDSTEPLNWLYLSQQILKKMLLWFWPNTQASDQKFKKEACWIEWYTVPSEGPCCMSVILPIHLSSPASPPLSSSC